MNFIKYLLVSLTMLLLLMVVACGDTDTTGSSQAPVPPAANSPIIPPANDASAATTPPPAAEPPQNAAGVWHYTCSNGCAGGGGSAVACATCGNTLAHNQAYHGNTTTPATPGAPGAPTQVATTPGGTPMTMFADPTKQPVNATMGAAPVQPAAAPEPAQNASGVWHYTCSNGCAGGAGSAVACATCGSTLAHNQGYH